MSRFFLSSLFVLSLLFGSTAYSQDLENAQKEYNTYKNIARDKKLSLGERLSALEKSTNAAKLISDSIYLNEIAYKSFLYSSKQDFSKAISETTKLRETALSLENPYFIAQSYDKMGRYLVKQQKDIEAFKNYVRAIELYSSLQDSINIIKVSKRASFIQSQIGDLDGTEFTIVNALDYSDALEDISELSWFYDVLGRIYRERSLWQEAIKHHRKALQLEISPKSKVALLNNYALTLIKADK